MTFSEALKEVIEKVEGALFAMILGTDGIPVGSGAAASGVSGTDEPLHSGIMDADTLGAETSQLIREAGRAAKNLQIGDTAEITILARSCAIIIRRINPEYFIALVMRSGAGSLGKGRFYLRQAVSRIENDF
ncbi:MAG: hypothetical protein M0Z48_03970 [Nitrospiraceae bacterium]|nr:hypothetical protein [Nitrospiraceae bacterium]